MKPTSKTIIFFGTESFSARSLRHLIDEGFLIGAVVTKPDSRRGRRGELQSPEVAEIARAHGIPVLQPLKLRDIADELAAFDNPVGVLVSYGKIIPQSIIDLFSPGIINVHPSLLPLYRGPSPIEAAILHGDATAGVSIMQLSAAMDAGPVYLQETISLDGTETASELYDTLGQRGAELLTGHLAQIIDGTLLPAPQDDSRATYCHLLTKEDGLLDPTQLTAVEMERRVRAYEIYPKTKLTLEGQLVIVCAAHVAAEAQPNELQVRGADESILVIDSLIGPSGRRMSGADFIRGYLR